MTEKSQVADIDRSIYDIRDAEHDAYRMEAGLTPAIVEKLSKEKNDPAWMEQFRLESLQIYNNMRVPDWGPSLDGLDIDHIATYVRPNTKMQNNWENVPQDIKDTFERLGIPQAERKSLAGVARSTTRSWCTTTCARKWRRRAWCTPTWRARCTANMPRWCASTS